MSVNIDCVRIAISRRLSLSNLLSYCFPTLEFSVGQILGIGLILMLIIAKLFKLVELSHPMINLS